MHRFVLATVLVALAGASVVVRGQGGTTWEWPTYGADLANTRYAPLDQIAAANFGTLQVAWRLKTENLGPRPEYLFEATPLMVGGRIYTTAGTRRAVVAADAATGEMLWIHGEDEGRRGAVAPRQLSGRGLAYWSDGREQRILYVTPGYRLIALDAKTGMPVTTFGKNGAVDLKEDDDQFIDPMNGEIGLHATPVVAKDVVIVGAAHKSGAVPTSRTNVKGYVRGFDVRTGKRLWIFHTIPMQGEFGYDTWEKESAIYTGNGGVWAQISVDPELETVYLPVELPTGDYFGANRPGAGLFGESIVAVDLHTGTRKWHYQLVHHGLWDNDIPCPPILADIVVNGRPTKALAQPTKQAMLYVLDRVTGKPIWPIEERPVPKGDVPGEWYSPTQPFPLDARGRLFAYDRQGFVEDDLIDFTPALRAEAKQLVSRYRIGPWFTPPVVSKAEGPLATLALGSAGGGTNWPGGSYDPENHIAFVSSNKALSQLGLVPADPKKTDMQYVMGTATAGARSSGGAGSNALAGDGRSGEGATAPAGGGLSPHGLPIMKPPYGQITAIDLTKGEIIWQVAHGETPENITSNPALKGVAIPRTGRPGTVGQLVTKTLLIAGESSFGPTPNGRRGAMLRAYDKMTGKELGSVFMPAPQTGGPMSYMLDGKQYIVVSIGGTGFPAELIAFRLPG
jgi:quinoprotein glucose dehydrogenase